MQRKILILASLLILTSCVVQQVQPTQDVLVIVPTQTLQPTTTPTQTVQPTATNTPTIEPTIDPVSYLTPSDVKMLIRQGVSECSGMGDQLDDCVKGVTSTVLARMALDLKTEGTFSLSDGTVYGTMSVYSGEFPQFTPYDWDEDWCDNHKQLCFEHYDWIDQTPYQDAVLAAILGDGGKCPGYLFYRDDNSNEPSECVVRNGVFAVHFHNGWGWTELLEEGEWQNWHN